MKTIDRIKDPIICCRRCGERFYASWQKDHHCPKCGRRPTKVQLWEAALCGLVPPVALVSAMIHKNDSPRATLSVLLWGLLGALFHAGLYALRR